MALRFVRVLRRRFRDLARDNRGASIIELAIVAPLLSAMVVGVTDLGRGFSAKMELNQAAQAVTSKLMQASFQSSGAEQLKKDAATLAGVGPEAVEVDYWLTCNGIKQNASNPKSAFDSSCADDEAPARYVVVRIAKTFVPMFTKANLVGSNDDGTYTLHSKAELRLQ